MQSSSALCPLPYDTQQYITALYPPLCHAPCLLLTPSPPKSPASTSACSPECAGAFCPHAARMLPLSCPHQPPHAGARPSAHPCTCPSPCTYTCTRPSPCTCTCTCSSPSSCPSPGPSCGPCPHSHGAASLPPCQSLPCLSQPAHRCQPALRQQSASAGTSGPLHRPCAVLGLSGPGYRWPLWHRSMQCMEH